MKYPDGQPYDASILEGVADYYGSRLKEHGMTAKGVDWNGQESQEYRFSSLSRILPQTGHFSIHDVGCGYGAMYDFLNHSFDDFSYLGSDISEDMTKAAIDRLHGAKNAQFFGPKDNVPQADFSVASGIFNVRLGHDTQSWRDYFWSTLDKIDQGSLRGFSFNCLTSHSDEEYMVDRLYYPDPAEVFDRCVKRYSRHVALLHDYGLYEFTILVRK